MSTYLIAWAVVPLDYSFKSDKTANGKEIRVFARKTAVDSGLVDFALQVAKISLDYFENQYFGLELSIAVPPKIDLIAIPDFPSGAMEHWGLIGFRETRLLYSSISNSISSKQNVAITVSHEIAHFWFGNLVTCEWWNDLWVNEAMADFLALKPLINAFPDWFMEEQNIVDSVIPVMWDDSFPTSHPIEANVTTPDQINTLFDSITYSKGSAVLKMLESVVTADGFKEGLKKYLQANKFGSGKADDFFNNLILPSDIRTKTTPAQFMGSWLKQMNYPKVSIELQVNNVDGTSNVRFEQSRFLTGVQSDTLPNDSPLNYIWEVYLDCIAGGTWNSDPNNNDQHFEGSNLEFKYFLTKPNGDLKLDRRVTWVFCNKDFKSFYTTSYSEDILKALKLVLDKNGNKVFSIGDRTNLYHVTYQLAYSGLKSYSTIQTFSSYLNSIETDYVPWKTVTYHINKIVALMQNRKDFNRLVQFGLNTINRISNSFNLWDENGGQLEKLLKANLIDFTCRLGDSKCLSTATLYFKTIPSDYFKFPNNNSNPVSPNIRSAVYKYHTQKSNDYRDWESLLYTYTQTIDPNEQAYILNALSYSQLSWILNLYLNEIQKSNSRVRLQDYFTVLAAVSRNPTGRILAWYFARENWDALIIKFGIQDRTFGRSIKSLTETFDTQFLYDEVLEFFKKYPDAGAAELPRRQALDIIKNNLFWIENQEPDILISLLK